MDFFKKKETETGVSLNNVQKQAVEKTDGPLLLIASPGSGKTTTMIMRIGYLIEEKGVDPSKILAVTFSKASAVDMDARFEKLFPDHPSGSVRFQTIHSLAFEITRRFLAGINYRLIEENNGTGTEKRRILEEIHQSVHGEKPTEDDTEMIQTYISYVKNRMVPDDSLEEAGTPQDAAIFRAYEERKRSSSTLLLDFDDMLTYALDALETDAAIRKQYQDRFSHVMTDESQDTSLVQHRIVERLVEHHQNLCVVGDDDQSIYSWRGATPEYLLDFKSVYPTAEILYMVRNYRSSQDIVDTANSFIKRNKVRYEKDMTTTNSSLKKPEIQIYFDYDEQIRELVKDLKAAKNKNEVAVLYRNNESAIALIDVLDKEGITFYQKEATNRFFRHFIIEDIKNILRLSYGTKVRHLPILEKVAKKLKMYLRKENFERIRLADPDADLWETLLDDPNLESWQKKNIKEAKRKILKFKDQKPQQVLRIIRRGEGLKYDAHLVWLCDAMGRNSERMFSILEMLEIIAGRENTVTDFIERLRRLEDLMAESRGNQGKDAVTLLTFHSSKGLEFDQVCMIDLTEGVVPSLQDRKMEGEGDSSYMEEAARLYYVGMTRARKELRLYSYTHKFEERTTPSGFLLETYALLNPGRKALPRWAKEIPGAEKIIGKDEPSSVQKKTLQRPSFISVSAPGDLIPGDRVSCKGKRGMAEVVYVNGDVATIRFESTQKTHRIKVDFLKKAL